MDSKKSIWTFSFTALIFISIVINVGISVIVPAMPAIMKSRGFTEFFLISAFVGLLIGRFISSNVIGFALVKYSPITLLVVAFSLHTLTMIMFTMVRSETLFVLLRFMEGIFEGVASVILQIMVIALSSPRDRGRKIGVFQSSYGMGFILGPALGGFALQWMGTQGVFFVTAGLMAIGLVWLLLVMASLKRDMGPSPQTEQKFNLEFLKYLPLYGGAILQRGIYVALSILLPLFLVDQYALPPYQVGLYFTGSAILAVVLLPIGGRLADTSARHTIIIVSIFVMGASFIGLGLNINQLSFTILYAVETIAFSFMAPSAMKIFGDAVQTHPRRGQIVGAASSSRELINIVVVLALVPLYKISHHWPWMLLGVLTIIFTLPYLRARRLVPA